MGNCSILRCGLRLSGASLLWIGRGCLAALLLLALPGAVEASPTVGAFSVYSTDVARQFRVVYDLDLGGAPSVVIGLQVALDGVNWRFATGLEGDAGEVSEGGGGLEMIWCAGSEVGQGLYPNALFRVVSMAGDGQGGISGFSWIPAGTFGMGNADASPGWFYYEMLHQVTLTRGFYLQQTEVTMGLWAAVRSEGPALGYTDLPEGIVYSGAEAVENYPVGGVSWHDCLKWLNLRSELEGLSPCYRVNGAVYRKGETIPSCDFGASGYRLPTEAEWERAGRAGIEGMAFHGWPLTSFFAEVDANLDLIGWYAGNSQHGAGPVRSARPVGLKMANAWGLFDMSGNVSEWCWDVFANYGQATVDPAGPVSGDVRMLRGGNYGSPPRDCRVSKRDWFPVTPRLEVAGLRAARSPQLWMAEAVAFRLDLRPFFVARPTALDGGYGASEFLVELETERPWSAVAGVTWLSVAPGEGAGNAVLKLKVEENYSRVKRVGTVAIGDLVLTIAQSGRPEIALDLVVVEGLPSARLSFLAKEGGVYDLERSDDLVVWETAERSMVAGRVLSAETRDHDLLLERVSPLKSGAGQAPGFYRVRRKPAEILVPAGTFVMGSLGNETGHSDDEKQHEVVLRKSFYLQQTEVTAADWEAFRKEGPRRGYTDLPEGEGAGQQPVGGVSWYDCLKWLNLRSEVEGLSPCYRVGGVVYRTGVATPDCDFCATGYRLPTEAEWEYACRAGSTTAFYNGPITHVDSSPLDPKLNEIGWYVGNSGWRPHDVGLKLPNSWLFYDMTGNVWEWCWDRYGESYYTGRMTDPRGPAAGATRVVRGGALSEIARHCRSAQRYDRDPTIRFGNFGLRCARTP